jgi:hypothetical protein
MYPGLRPGDVPAGSMARMFQENQKLWNGAYNAGKLAFIGTGVVLAGVPAAGEAATTAAGDFLFARGTGLLNSNDVIRIGWAWARTSLLDYPYGGLTYFGVRILNWHLNNAIWSYPSH